MIRKYYILLVGFLFLTQYPCKAQGQVIETPVLTADSLKSGNYKDILTSFFQLAFNNLTGPNKELKFSSTPFAIMARAHPELYAGRYWYQYRHLRDLNFSLSLKADSSFRLNSFAGGIKYALVNKRDLTVSKAFFKKASESAGIRKAIDLDRILTVIQSRIPIDSPFRKKFREETNKLTSKDEKWSFSDLSEDVQKYIKDKVAELADTDQPEYQPLFLHPDVSPYESLTEEYNQLKDEFLKKSLWTVGAEGASYTDRPNFANITVGSQYLTGVGANGLRTFTYEADIKAQFKISDDSLLLGHDLNRQVFSFEPGFNFAIRTRQDNKSYFEFKLSGSYYRVFSTLHNLEKKDSLTLNTEIRLRIYDDIWVPLILKYDPKHGNLFGFLNISANFTGIAGLLRKKGDK